MNLLPGSISEDNETLEKIISFEDVREEIRLRIIEEDRLDAERDAKDLAREASLNFLDQINSLRDRIKNRYANFKDARNSMELNTLIAETGGVERKISLWGLRPGMDISGNPKKLKNLCIHRNRTGHLCD